MARFQLSPIPDDLLAAVKQSATARDCSASAFVVALLEAARQSGDLERFDPAGHLPEGSRPAQVGRGRRRKKVQE
jgi:hypothetical protein